MLPERCSSPMWWWTDAELSALAGLDLDVRTLTDDELARLAYPVSGGDMDGAPTLGAP